MNELAIVEEAVVLILKCDAECRAAERAGEMCNEMRKRRDSAYWDMQTAMCRLLYACPVLRKCAAIASYVPFGIA
jgi:hypothetical protein